MKDFFLDNYSVITKSVEFIAAISGTYYLKKNKNSVLKIFVFYLWLTFFVELIGEYSGLMRNNYDKEWFIKLKNSVFCKNMWLYNIYSFLSIGLLGVFYSGLLSNKSLKILIRAIVIFYSIFSIFYYTFTDAFFVLGLPYDDILASVIVSIYVISYFIELMNSEYILQYYKLPSFYISVALLLWYLCVTPLFIFNAYFREVNADFVIFRYLLLLFINICTYLCFAFGFWYSLKKSKQ
ncbi:hypothetical protein [Psychroserpens sp.]|uniref:hypothetical protein n=1 Tax=Psychroserpens sp. TaxID=2020870 RepID=UPI003002D5A0